MFAEYLEKHSMEEMIAAGKYSLFPPAEDRTAWEGISASDRKEIRALAEKYREIPYPMRRATDFLAFVRSGSRNADEEPYFLRRRKLCASVLACCAAPETSLDDVIDGLWCICEESSWVISAHNVNDIPGAPSPAEYPLPDADRPYVDLFAAQTGMILALTVGLLENRLNAVSEQIVSRVRREIERRILKPFLETDDFWWMGFRRKDLCNWTPWIVSNVMMAACAVGMEPSDLAALLDRGCRMLDRWLEVVPADGGCDEGAGYWNMAGGALLDCLELLERVTKGQMTFWQEEKLRNILTFPVKAEIGEGWFLNFADCDARPFLSGERLQYAGERLDDPALRSLGRRTRGTLSAQLDDVPHFSRLLRMLFHPSAGDAEEAKVKVDVWLPDLQVRIVRRGDWTLCCKGGHNGESHNHNDVGSFMLYLNEEPRIVDAGNMTYTAKTFSDRRYELWNTRSACHNVPLIGEWEQRAGKEYAAREVQWERDGLSLEMAGAYDPAAGVKSLRREMILTEKGLCLHDAILLEKPQPVTWVFLLRNQPEMNPGRVDVGEIQLAFSEALRCEIEEIPITDSRMARNFPGSLWRVCLAALPGQEQEETIWVRRII